MDIGPALRSPLEFNRLELHMKKQLYIASLLSAALIISACDGSDGANGIDGQDGANGADGSDGYDSLVDVRDVPVGDVVCLGGGQALDSGLDTNRNGILDPSEVTATNYLECAVTPTLRALHASPDAPLVNIWIDEAPALTDVDFNQGSGFVGVGLAENVTESGANVGIRVEGIIPGGNANVLNEILPIDFGTETTVIATGSIEEASFGPIIITNEAGADIADGSFRAQVVHASPSAPPVDVYVAALDGALENPVNGGAPLAFGEYTGRLEVPAGPYQIRIAVPVEGGDPIVVYDSGEVPLPAGADLMIVATENVFLGESAVQLMVLDGTAAAPLYDKDTPAAALAVHLSPDAPAVDVLADVGSTAEMEMIKLVENLAYTESCVINPVGAPEDYTLSVVATGDMNSVLDIPYSAAVNEGTAVIVSGKLGDMSLTALPLAVDGRSVWTETKLRITHGSPSTPNVDIYLLADGQLPSDDDTAPAFIDVPFGADTGVLKIQPGVTYDAFVTATGSTDPAITIEDFTPANGQVLEVIARDAFGDETLPQVVIIDYDAAEDCVVN
jgi:hypothetical protein